MHPPPQKCPTQGMDTHHQIPAGRQPHLKAERSLSTQRAPTLLCPPPHLSTPLLSPLPWVPPQPVTVSPCSVGCACPHEPAGHQDVPRVHAEVPSWGQYLEISVTRQSQELQPLGKKQQPVTACDSSATPTLPGWGHPGSPQGQEPLQEAAFLPGHLPGFGVLSGGQQQGEDSKRR